MPLREARVLVVDDIADNRKSLLSMLVIEGCAVLTADDGPAALRTIGRERIDVVLLDVNMPTMGGIEVTRRLKLDETTKHIPIIVVTALQDEDTRLQALTAGAEDFLSKPVGRVELCCRITNLLRLKRAQDALRAQVHQKTAEADAQVAQIRAVVEATRDWIVILDERGQIEFINHTEPVVRGKRMAELLADEYDGVVRDAMRRALSSDDPIPFEITIDDLDGPRWFSSRMHCFWGADGVRRFLAFISDITAQRQAEREVRAKTEQLRQAQKMEALGTLAGGVAHDFNNLLTSIISFTSFAKADAPENSTMREDLDEVLRAAHSATRLTSQLLSFSRRRPVEPVVLDLNEELVNVSKMLRRTLGEHVELVILPHDEPLDVMVDPGQLDQVIFNLAVNARDAMQDGGKLTISTYLEDIADLPPLEEGQYAVIRFEDTGVGMDEQTAQRIFEPFFSTKGERGTGLGLSTCFGIVRQAGGDIMVQTRAGEGTTVMIHLPISRQAPRRVLTKLPRQRRRYAGDVLVVEDQPAILRAAARAIGAMGFDVHVARTAEEAQTLVSNGLEVDLMVTDVVLPGLTGVALRDWLHQRSPDIPVVFTSGYIGEDDRPNIEGDAHTAFLPKPFTSDALRSRIEGLMAVARPSHAGGSILVVADDEDERARARRVLERMGLGHAVETVDSGRRALDELFGTGPGPQLVLLEPRLADLSGVDVIRQARAHASTAETPMVLLTESKWEEDELRATKPGATALLRKPLTVDKVSAILNEVGLSWMTSGVAGLLEM